MNIVRGDGRDFSDDEVNDALRSLYTPPSDESYWSSLERRIMAAVGREKPREWWSWFPGWVRVGMSMAAAAILVAVVASWHTRAAQERVAAERLLGNPQELPILTESVRGERDVQREATLRYLITHD